MSAAHPTALLAEDEPMLRAMLKARLAECWPELRIVGEAANGEEAAMLAARLAPDIAFLDIRMPLRSGLEVAREIGSNCHVVFVTAYDEYAVAAFEAGAVDYVLKPPARERLEKVVARLKDRIAQPPVDLSSLIAKLGGGDGGRAPAAAPLRWVRASLGSAVKVIEVGDVLYFQAEDKYTKVVTADGEALIRKPIKELFDELDPELFWQVHRSTIVNVRAIARVERDWRDQPLISLKGRSEKLTVSRTFAHRFKAM